MFRKTIDSIQGLLRKRNQTGAITKIICISGHLNSINNKNISDKRRCKLLIRKGKLLEKFNADDVEKMIIFNQMANFLAKKGITKDMVVAPEHVCPENRIYVTQNLTPVRKQITKNAAPISNDIVRSLKINAANTRHNKTMTIAKKQCIYSKFRLFDASINHKYSTYLYKLNDYTLDKTKNIINKLQHDKFFVKFKAWDKMFDEAKLIRNKYCSYDYYVEKYGDLQNLKCPLCDNEFEDAQHLFTKCAKTLEFRR